MAGQFHEIQGTGVEIEIEISFRVKFRASSAHSYPCIHRDRYTQGAGWGSRPVGGGAVAQLPPSSRTGAAFSRMIHELYAASPPPQYSSRLSFRFVQPSLHVQR